MPLYRLVLALLAVFALASPARAEDTAACLAAAKPGWSASEAWAWGQICAGKPADFAAGLPGTPFANDISARFMNALLFDANLRGQVPHSGVHIAGAHFVDALALANAAPGFELALERSDFLGNVDFHGLSDPEEVSFAGSRFASLLDLDGAKLGANLKFNDGAEAAYISMVRTTIGGSANLNAIALQYGVTKDGTLYAAVNAVDNILTTIWLFMTMLLPPVLQRLFPRKRRTAPEIKNLSEEELMSLVTTIKVNTTIADISLLLAMGFGTLFLSTLLTNYIPQIPSILTLTSIALLLAQLPFVQKLKGGKLIGLLLIMIFLAVIGAFCDISALMHSSEVAGILLVWDTVLITIHGIIIFTVGGLFRQDWDIVSIASNANIGGATSAPVCAARFNERIRDASASHARSTAAGDESFRVVFSISETRDEPITAASARPPRTETWPG